MSEKERLFAMLDHVSEFYLTFLGLPIFEDFFLFVDFFLVRSISVQSFTGKAGLSSGSSMSGATGI